MTRSLRQNPFVPNSNNESEKSDKVLAHQRERKWIHDHLTPSMATTEDYDIVSFHKHPRSGRGSFAKAGKSLHAEDAGAFRK